MIFGDVPVFAGKFFPEQPCHELPIYFPVRQDFSILPEVGDLLRRPPEIIARRAFRSSSWHIGAQLYRFSNRFRSRCDMGNWRRGLYALLCLLRISKSRRVNRRPILFSMQSMQRKCFMGIFARALFWPVPGHAISHTEFLRTHHSPIQPTLRVQSWHHAAAVIGMQVKPCLRRVVIHPGPNIFIS